MEEVTANAHTSGRWASEPGDFMRAQLYAAVATLKIGLDIIRNEGIRIDYLTGHGGLFKTPGSGTENFIGSTEGSRVQWIMRERAVRGHRASGGLSSQAGNGWHPG